MAVPVIASINYGSGYSFIINGTGFLGTTAVLLGALPLAFEIDSDIRINATAGPEVPSGSYDLSVTNPDGTALASAVPLDLIAYERPGLVGGIRARMIRDSFRALVRSGLFDLGWFADNPGRLPIKWVDRPANWDEPVELNSIAITMEDVADEQVELGSTLSEDRWIFSVDFYAEKESLGVQLINDVRDILRGKFGLQARGGPRLPVYDLRVNDSEVIFTCELENVVTDRARNFPNAWQRNWFVVMVDVVDTYDHDDPGDLPVGSGYEGGY